MFHLKLKSCCSYKCSVIGEPPAMTMVSESCADGMSTLCHMDAPQININNQGHIDFTGNMLLANFYFPQM